MANKNSGTRIYPYLSPKLHKRFKRYCQANGHSDSSVVEAALNEYLDDTKDMTLLLRRLDRQQRSQGRLQRDVDILMEAFAVYVQLWYSYKPNLKGKEREAAMASGSYRYQQYVDYVARQYGGGHRFVDDLAKDISDDEELQSILNEENNANQL